MPCLGLVWSGPLISALPWLVPATTSGRLLRPAAPASLLLLLLALQQSSSTVCQTGNSKVKVLNLKVVKVMSEDNILIVKGSVAGHNNSYITVRM